MSRLLLVDHEGRPIADTPTPSPEAETLEQTISAREFDKFTAEEARKASTRQEN
jgi:hypothetical protein